MSKTYININGDVRDASSLTVPADRTFRDAWQFEGDAITVDMDKAKDIHRDTLRAERAPRLSLLDVALMKVLETNGDNSEVVAAKIALRDVTADAKIAAAKTPEELSALTLDALIGG